MNVPASWFHTPEKNAGPVLGRSSAAIRATRRVTNSLAASDARSSSNSSQIRTHYRRGHDGSRLLCDVCDDVPEKKKCDKFVNFFQKKIFFFFLFCFTALARTSSPQGLHKNLQCHLARAKTRGDDFFSSNCIDSKRIHAYLFSVDASCIAPSTLSRSVRKNHFAHSNVGSCVWQVTHARAKTSHTHTHIITHMSHTLNKMSRNHSNHNRALSILKFIFCHLDNRKGQNRSHIMRPPQRV
jgi:hypothetical protein